MFPNCEIKLNNEEALDQHTKTHLFTAAAPYIDINRLALAANDFLQHHDPASSTPLSHSGSATDHTTMTVSSLAPDGPIVCAHSGCNQTFTRAADLERHMGKHQDGPKDYHCWEPGYRRNGVNGFYRRDKLVAHQKRHRE